jgi:protein phosphatase methylesterase 1
MDPPRPADANPGWTRAPWAGVIQPPASSSAVTMPPPPPRQGTKASRDANDGASTSYSSSTTTTFDRAALFEPADLSAYFDESTDVIVGDSVFRVRTARARRVDADATNAEGKGAPPHPSVAIFCLHGCALAGASFALFARALADRAGPNTRVDAMDLRGHGSTRTGDDADLSLDRMARDVADVCAQLYGSSAGDSVETKVVLVGHSMGGAVAARVAQLELVRHTRGVVVIDVVEGTALASVRGVAMRNAVAARPGGFASIAGAIEWCARVARTTSNLESARASTPCTVVPSIGVEGGYEWRVDVSRTSRYWEGWYAGMSERFLSARCAKLLVLAGHDRLDDALTVAQMQGKFQAVLFPNAGHAVHEDEPERCAEAVLGFAGRYAGGVSATFKS